MGNDDESEETLFAQIGIHLLLVQDFEHLLRFALKVALRDRKDLSIDSITEEDRRTMGQFMRDLRKDALLREDLDLLLKQVLADRNLFVHQLRHQDWFETTTREGRARIWRWFLEAQPRLEEAIMVFTAFAFHFGREIGFPEDLSKVPWHGDFLEELTSKYMPKVNELIRKKG